MFSRLPGRFPATAVLFCTVAACRPTVDLSGTYIPVDYPWSGLARIDIRTEFPAPWFDGTFTVYDFLEYTEIPIRGTVNDRNQIRFTPRHIDPTIWGLCVCQGLDDGSSIYSGSGEIAGDGLGDRLSCGRWLGESFDPPAELFRADWPEAEASRDPAG